jgi:hypothetical protein
MTLILLYLLATTDGALCGYRAAAGRSALINKRVYFRKALLRGAVIVQFAAAFSGLLLLAILAASSDRSYLMSDLLSAGARMIEVFVPYAVLVLLFLTFRLIPSVDVRSATSVMVLGPMTAARPFLAVAGVLFGILPANTLRTKVLGLTVLGLMFAVQFLLDRLAARDAKARMVSALAHSAPSN